MGRNTGARRVTVTLTITDGVQPIAGSHWANLRDARAALIRYQNHRGLHFTINPWIESRGFAVQDGVLRTGMQIVGGWTISYPLTDTYEGERLPA
jgi:hypothetical protein